MDLSFFKKDKKEELSLFGDELSADVSVKDIVSPSFIEIKQNLIKLEEKLTKTFFIFSYPRFLTINWLSPIINFNRPIDISFFIYPTESEKILKTLRKKVTEVQAELSEQAEKGLIRDPSLEAAYGDLEELRDRLYSAQERMFRLGIYLTIYADTEKELSESENEIKSFFEGKMVYTKPALFKQREGFVSTSPYGLDLLQINTSMNTEPLSSTFPFVSFDLTSNDGILYGINRHNNSLVLFNRFNLESYNEVVFGTAGSGKSYLVKLESLRYLMIGVDVIIIDPENEYKALANAIGGKFFDISLASQDHINPFDLPLPGEDERIEDVLRSNVINLVGLLRIMLGGLTPEEDSIIDQAITETYAAKDINPESDPKEWEEKVPILSDLEQVLESMEGAESLIRRLRKFTQGAYAGFFNQKSNITLKENLTVFGVRNLEEELRPMAMFIIMRYIWKTVSASLKKRILVVDEAWWLMQSEDGASFLFGLVKRARKYWLGVTTITQDVSDFMKSDYGKPIINNSPIKMLLKQSPAVINVVQETFGLTEEEKMILLEGIVGEGIFFAGKKHVAMRIMASYLEDQIVTTSPEKISQLKKQKQDYLG
jgi:conjugal transfer ATP-binding protein TraC